MLTTVIDLDSRLRLRPSVAMVPQSADQYQFFQGNTRRSRVCRICATLSRAISQLDGNRNLAEAADCASADRRRLCALAHALHEACILEHSEISLRIVGSPWRRVLQFFGDYFPSTELESAFEQIGRVRIVVLGVGAVGSWVAVQLVQSGVKQITLVDPDVVENSNLNRSLFFPADSGHKKVNALARRLQHLNRDVQITTVDSEVADVRGLEKIVGHSVDRTIVLNCADSPSVDATSSLVDRACRPTGIPYIIAGGYNLHLSLIGMTVIPGVSACYNCSRITLEEIQGDDLADVRKLYRPWRNIGNLAPLAAITASFTANEALRVALDGPRLRPAMLNRRGEYNFLTNRLNFTDLPPRSECGCTQVTPA